jgi:hypothetical protein
LDDGIGRLTGELIGQKNEVIVVLSPQSASTAQRATKTIPSGLATL